jgi:hypothetical protein
VQPKQQLVFTCQGAHVPACMPCSQLQLVIMCVFCVKEPATDTLRCACTATLHCCYWRRRLLLDIRANDGKPLLLRLCSSAAARCAGHT